MEAVKHHPIHRNTKRGTQKQYKDTDTERQRQSNTYRKIVGQRDIERGKDRHIARRFKSSYDVGRQHQWIYGEILPHFLVRQKTTFDGRGPLTDDDL